MVLETSWSLEYIEDLPFTAVTEIVSFKWGASTAQRSREERDRREVHEASVRGTINRKGFGLRKHEKLPPKIQELLKTPWPTTIH